MWAVRELSSVCRPLVFAGRTRSPDLNLVPGSCSLHTNNSSKSSWLTMSLFTLCKARPFYLYHTIHTCVIIFRLCVPSLWQIISQMLINVRNDRNRSQPSPRYTHRRTHTLDRVCEDNAAHWLSFISSVSRWRVCFHLGPEFYLQNEPVLLGSSRTKHKIDLHSRLHCTFWAKVTIFRWPFPPLCLH